MLGAEAFDDVEPVFRLIYRSHDLIGPDRRTVELGSLFTVSRSNNKRQGVTGALLVAEDRFVQALEGDESVVRDLFGHIAADPRHDGVELVATSTAPRAFARWAMAEVSAHGGADIPLIAHRDGIAPAAGHRPTIEQTVVLNVMREVAFGVPVGRV